MAVTIDFEARSAKSIKAGAHTYASHPSTEVLCLAYAIDDGPVKLWHPNFDNATPSPLCISPYPEDLCDRVRGGDLIEAHNAMFERCMWHYIMVERWGFPPIEPSQWRCSAAIAAAHAIPRKLEKACEAMDTAHKKNLDGHRVMMKMCKPRKPRKGEDLPPPGEYLWHEKTEDFAKLFAYCIDDVAAERSLSESLSPLTTTELKVWQMDQEVNWRGVKIDMGMVDGALDLLGDALDDVNAKIAEVTHGAVEKVTQRAKFLSWLQASDVIGIYDTQAQTLKDYLEYSGVDGVPQIHDYVREALTLWLEGNKASVKKYARMASDVAPDGRIHDTIMYHGASTGRWSGKGVQVQNVKRGYSSTIDMMCDAVASRDVNWLNMFAPNVIDALSNCVRGAFTAGTGKTLVTSDYAAIEARGTFWLAKDEDALGIFLRPGGDIYCVMASEIFGREVTPSDKFERFIGKQAILGLGYQMGFLKWIDTIHKYKKSISVEQSRATFGADYDMLCMVALNKDIDPKVAGDWSGLIRSMRFRQSKLTPEDIHEQLFAANVVRTYRNTYWKVKELWGDMEAAAVKAVQHPGKAFACSYVKWRCDRDMSWLKCKLPSGRMLYFREPQIRKGKLPWGGTKPQLTHMAVDGQAKKWRRCPTYGGKLVENVVQGLSRDVMAEAMLRLADAGFDMIMTVHDEIVAEVDEVGATLVQFENVMRQVPDWATGFPVAVEGWIGKRYRK